MIEPGRAPAKWSRFWILIGWRGGGKQCGWNCWNGRGGMAASLRLTGGARGLEGLWVKPEARYPSGGHGSSTGGTGSGKSRAVNLAGLA